mmetsp:Transcript_14066/g.24657  ORF Transcript_14066/g.24657 Transcript_14066/m.24657 type:complete len:230 (+) Transcript_14066:432-1121(+)
MILNGHSLLLGVNHTGTGAIIEVNVGHLDTGRKRGGVNRKVMVLAANLNAAGRSVTNGVIRAMMTELELESLASKRLAKDLVSHTNTENGLLAEDGLGIINGVGSGGGITGTIAKEYTIRVHLKDLRGGIGGGDDGDAASKRSKTAEDILLDSEIIGNNMELLLIALKECAVKLPLVMGTLSPLIRLGAANYTKKVLTNNGPVTSHLKEFRIALGGIGRDSTDKAAMLT